MEKQNNTHGHSQDSKGETESSGNAPVIVEDSILKIILI